MRLEEQVNLNVDSETKTENLCGKRCCNSCGNNVFCENRRDKIVSKETQEYREENIKND